MLQGGAGGPALPAGGAEIRALNSCCEERRGTGVVNYGGLTQRRRGCGRGPCRARHLYRACHRRTLDEVEDAILASVNVQGLAWARNHNADKMAALVRKVAS